MPRFRHEPLQNALTQIRLLQLLPYNEDRDIRCGLQIYGLAGAPAYVALSYECGPSDTTVDILVNDRWFSIRHNLWLFLSQLKEKQHCHKAFEDVLIWADAICISQSDIPERNAQVGNMGSIFHRAICTYAWLGWPSGINAAATFAFLSAGVGLERPTMYDYGSWQHHVAEFAGKHSQMLTSVAALCQLTYFRRRWILQEVLRSREVVLIWGESELPWDFFLAFLNDVALPQAPWSSRETITRPRLLTDIDASLPTEIASYVRHHGTHDTFQKVPLLKLMCDFQDSECEQATDRIYSLLGLSEEQAFLGVDYSLSTTALLCKIMGLTRWTRAHDVRLVISALELQIPTLLTDTEDPQRSMGESTECQNHEISTITSFEMSVSTTVRQVFTLPGTLYHARQFSHSYLSMPTTVDESVAHKFSGWTELTESIIEARSSHHNGQNTANAAECDSLDDLWYCFIALARYCRSTRCFSSSASASVYPDTAVALQDELSSILPMDDATFEASNYQPGRDDAQILVCENGQIAVCRCPAVPGDVLCEFDAFGLCVIRENQPSRSQLAGEARMVFEDVGPARASTEVRQSLSLPSCLPRELRDFWTAWRRRYTASQDIPEIWDTQLQYRPAWLRDETHWRYSPNTPASGLRLDGHLVLQEAFRSSSEMTRRGSLSERKHGALINVHVNTWDYVRLCKERRRPRDRTLFVVSEFEARHNQNRLHRHSRHKPHQEGDQDDPLERLLHVEVLFDVFNRESEKFDVLDGALANVSNGESVSFDALG